MTTSPALPPSDLDLGPVFQLIPGVQSYDWGIKGKSCRVAQFAAGTSQLGFSPDENKPYAELWMGTHSSLPSRIVSPQSDAYPELSWYLRQNPQLIGSSVASKFSDEEPGCLPFLFKVLSVGKALSIQAHPDKQLGKKLHSERPQVYKDPNHKPEMAIALTSFSGFCGFRPLAEIVHFLNAVPEFALLVSLSSQELEHAAALASQSISSDEKQVKAVLKIIFGNLMRSEEQIYQAQAAKLTQRLSNPANVADIPEEERQLLLRLSEQFPLDIGIFCTFLLNISHLEPGEALFLQANEPHAYLDGEILECMASSDNVVRAGLTPKLRDVETLVDMCTYQSGKGRGRMQPQSWDRKSGNGEATLYDPPIAEFSVVVGSVDTHQSSQTHAPLKGPSILLAMQGSGSISYANTSSEIKEGQIFFVGAETPLELSGTFKFARAYVEA